MRMRYIVFSLFAFSSLALFAAMNPALTLQQKLALARHLADEAAQGKAETGRVLTGDFDFAKELKRCRELGKIPELKQESISEYSDITTESPTHIAGKSEKQDEQKGNAETLPVKTKYVVDTSKDFINGYYTGIIGGDSEANDVRKKEVEEMVKLDKKLSQMPNFFSFKGRLFDLLSDNYQAHSTMIYVLSEFEKVFDLYFSNNDNQLVLLKKISVRVTEEKNPKRNTAMSISDTGDLSLYIAWTKSLSVEEFCDAFASAALSKIAYENEGRTAVDKVPLWIKMAIARLLEQSIRYGVASELANISTTVPPPLPLNVFGTAESSNVWQANSYWTLISIERVLKDKSVLSAFMRRVLVGESPKSLVEKLSIYKPKKYDFDLWWRCLITGEIWARMGGVLSPKRSAEEVARLAVMQVNTQDGQRVGLTVAKLWEQRDSLESEIKQRILEVKVALSNINPIYYNSLVSLGRMYEAIQDSKESDFNEAKKQFISEYKLAKTLEPQVRKMLNK